MLGRIYAAREMFARLAFLIGGLLFATLADFIPIRSIYMIAAACTHAPRSTRWPAPRCGAARSPQPRRR